MCINYNTVAKFSLLVTWRMSSKPCTLRCARVLRHHGGSSLSSAAEKKSALYHLGNLSINVKVFPNKKKDKMVTDALVKGCV